MEINYSKYISADESTVLKTIHHIESWQNWWPHKFRAAHLKKHDKDFLYFSPMIGFTIVWAIKKTSSGVNTVYVRGPLLGKGQLLISSDENGTRVQYNITVTPKNIFFKLLFRPSLFKRVHLKHMDDLFSSLENYLRGK